MTVNQQSGLIDVETDRNAFHLEEYRQIRTEIATLLARIENLFRYSLVVAAAIYSWLIVQSVGLDQGGRVCLKLPVDLLRPGWLIPPVFILLAGALAFSAYWRVRQMGVYLGMIEDVFGAQRLGWEKFLRGKCPIVTGTTVAIWLLLFGAAICATKQGLNVVEGRDGEKVVHVAACKVEPSK